MRPVWGQKGVAGGIVTGLCVRRRNPVTPLLPLRLKDAASNRYRALIYPIFRCPPYDAFNDQNEPPGSAPWLPH
jgi:hypothetical protein